MSFELLNSHDAIAWDFDGTLVGHSRSVPMHRYILAHPEKRHVIVTFRSHGMEDDIWDRLSRQYPSAPGEALFDGIISVPYEVFERFADQTRRTSLYRMPDDDADTDTLPAHPDVQAYIEWKGEVCREHGLTVLVDDNAAHTEAGCLKHGIAYINPDDL